MDGADRTKKAGAADNRGSDGLQFPSFRLGSVSDPDTRGQQNADKRGAERREHVGDINHPSGIDTRKPSRLHIGADGKDIATKPALVQKDVGGNGDDGDHPEKIRHAEKVASRETGEVYRW